MQFHFGKVPRARKLSGSGQELSREACARLQWMDFYRAHRNAALTCRRFGITRQTFYRWRRRFDPQCLATLEDRSHRPHRRRQPTWTPELADRVLQFRRQYPRWGKEKLAVLLAREGSPVSVSMVGRILTRLKQRGVLREPPRAGVQVLRRARFRRYGVRKPCSWCVSQPGDLVEVDTLELRPGLGVVLKQFTARDVVEAHGRATAALAAQFLSTLQ